MEPFKSKYADDQRSDFDLWGDDYSEYRDEFESSFVVKITVVTSVMSGTFNGLTVYDWIEQEIELGTGLYQTAANPRVGSYSVDGNNPLVENNSLSASVNTLQTIRLRGVVNGNPLYEFNVDGGSGGSGITVVDVTGSHTYTSVTELDFTYFTSSRSSSGAPVFLTPQIADRTQLGMILSGPAATQEIAGVHSFVWPTTTSGSWTGTSTTANVGVFGYDTVTSPSTYRSGLRFFPAGGLIPNTGGGSGYDQVPMIGGFDNADPTGRFVNMFWDANADSTDYANPSSLSARVVLTCVSDTVPLKPGYSVYYNDALGGNYFRDGAYGTDPLGNKIYGGLVNSIASITGVTGSY